MSAANCSTQFTIFFQKTTSVTASAIHDRQMAEPIQSIQQNLKSNSSLLIQGEMP